MNVDGATRERAARPIPRLPTVPVLGSLPFLLGRDGVLSGLTRAAEGFRDEGLFRAAVPGIGETTFVCNADLAAEMVDDAHWEKALDPILLRARELGGDGLFTARGDEPNWDLAHRILAPAFSGAAMHAYFEVKRAALDELVAAWSLRGGTDDVVADTTRLALETIARIGFGETFHSFRRRRLHPFLGSLGATLDEVAFGAFRPPVFAPYERYRRLRFDRDRARMFRHVDRVVATRRATPRESWPSDLLSRMLADADPRTGRQLDDTNVRFQIMTFLVAGHETTASLMAFALHYVARDPALAAQLRAEVRTEVGDGPLTFDAVRRLQHVGRVLDECLRLHPPAILVVRAPKRDTLLGGRYRIAAGEPVTLLVSAVHRDPSVYPAPLRFDPDRFLPDAVRARPSHAYKPFGIGKRICIGRSFALVEAALAIATLVRTFDLDPPGPLRLAVSAAQKPARFALRARPAKLR